MKREMINSICVKSSEIFRDSAQACIPDKSYSNHTKSRKPWFGRQCAVAHKRYHLAKTKYSKNPSSSTRSNLVLASKAYKKKMNNFINNHKRQTQMKLRNLKNKNPKEYWKIINSVDSKKQLSKFGINTLYTFFKELNDNDKCKSENDQTEETLNISLEDNDVILNSPITDREILKCIKSLKNNKACGNDEIINEYIKTTSNIFIIYAIV